MKTETMTCCLTGKIYIYIAMYVPGDGLKEEQITFSYISHAHDACHECNNALVNFVVRFS